MANMSQYRVTSAKDGGMPREKNQLKHGSEDNHGIIEAKLELAQK